MSESALQGLHNYKVDWKGSRIVEVEGSLIAAPSHPLDEIRLRAFGRVKNDHEKVGTNRRRMSYSGHRPTEYFGQWGEWTQEHRIVTYPIESVIREAHLKLMVGVDAQNFPKRVYESVLLINLEDGSDNADMSKSSPISIDIGLNKKFNPYANVEYRPKFNKVLEDLHTDLLRKALDL